MINKIAFSGKFRSGKTEASNCLVTNKGFNSLSFANKVKEYAKKYFNMVGKDRPLLQSVGEFGRFLDPNIWVNLVLDEMKSLEGKGETLFCIDDLRYKNEFNILKDQGFILCRVECDLDIRKSRDGFKNGDPNHISETDLDDYLDKFDYILYNNGTMSDFYSDVLRILG